MKISYKDFKLHCFNSLTQKDKNTLFYWSLMDPSGWEEFPPSYYPSEEERNKAVRSIFIKFSKLNKYLKHKNFVKDFIDQEFLSNYLIAAEIEVATKEKIKPDITNLEKTIFPDILLISNETRKISIEIKRVISTSNLKDRIEKEVKPVLTPENKYFLLLLLFPLCKPDDPGRINDLIEGYYVYETILGELKTRKVICQCVSLDNSNKKYILGNLLDRIIDGYFKKLELLD